MARAQRDVGLTVAVAHTFTAGEDLSLADELRREGIDVVSIGPAKPFLSRHPSIAPALRRLIGGVDVVHIHALWEEIQHRAATVARQTCTPYLIQPHGMLDPWSLSQGRLKKRLYLAVRLKRDLNAAAALAFTDESERDLAASLRLRPTTIVEPLAPDLGDFIPPPEKGGLRRRLPALASRVVLFMSRLHPKKGLDLLIPAFARANLDNTCLVLAGPCDDVYRATLEAIIARENLIGRAHFAGMLRGRERAEALVDADVFALPSYQENFGIVVVESLAVGTPVIISDQVGIHKQVSAAGCGIVTATTIDSVAAALTRALADGEFRRSASAAAPAFVANFGRERVAQDWAAHYAQIVRTSASLIRLSRGGGFRWILLPSSPSSAPSPPLAAQCSLYA